MTIKANCDRCNAEIPEDWIKDFTFDLVLPADVGHPYRKEKQLCVGCINELAEVNRRFMEGGGCIKAALDRKEEKINA